MVKLKGIINNVSYYIDEYMENNKILKGTKGTKGSYTSKKIYFVIIGNEKTINIIFNKFRSEKIKRLLKNEHTDLN
jgi:hypothetical protein